MSRKWIVEMLMAAAMLAVAGWLVRSYRERSELSDLDELGWR